MKTYQSLVWPAAQRGSVGPLSIRRHVEIPLRRRPPDSPGSCVSGSWRQWRTNEAKPKKNLALSYVDVSQHFGVTFANSSCVEGNMGVFLFSRSLSSSACCCLLTRPVPSHPHSATPLAGCYFPRGFHKASRPKKRKEERKTAAGSEHRGGHFPLSGSSSSHPA